MENMGRILRSKFPRENLHEYQEMLRQLAQDKEIQQFIMQAEVPDAQAFIATNASKLYEYYDVKQKIAAGQKTFMPGYTPALSLVRDKVEVTYIPTAELVRKQQAQAAQKRFTTINVPKSMRNANFRNYQREEGRDAALLAAVNFVKEYVSNPGEFHQGLYLTGPFGVGKTYLMAAMAHELARKDIACTLAHFPSLAVRFKDSISENVVLKEINGIKQAPILILDDIGAETMSGWLRDDVLGVILEYRMQEELPTFFTSNKTQAELEEHLAYSTNSVVEPLKAKRIMERVRYLSKEMAVSGKNWRRN